MGGAAAKFQIVPRPGMDNDTQAIAGCATILALVSLAPFVIMAIPVLLGAALGALGFWLLMLLISAVAGAIFK